MSGGVSAYTLVPIAAFAARVVAAIRAAGFAGVDLSQAVVTPASGGAARSLAEMAGPPDWLSGQAAYQLSWPVGGAQTAILSPKGQIALTTGSRASDLSNAYGSLQTTIGTASFAINDDLPDSSGRHVTVYAGYDEAQAQPGAGGLTFGREIDAVTLGGVAAPAASPGQPLSWGTGEGPGSTAGLWIASGGEHAGAADASFAIGIKDNGARFRAGIVFGAQALTDHGGTGYAARLARGHVLQWHDADDAEGPRIGSTVADAANAVSLRFEDAGVVFANADGAVLATVRQVAGAVNGATLTPGPAGAPVGLTADGADTDIDILLVPKGAGAVRVPARLEAGGDVCLGAAARSLGFYGAAGGRRPTVSGTRGGNAALTSLVAALAGLGLITDATTA
ncbi:exported protein of unknown function [Rhodovastum atsumiense]|uniref:hypothetical protein n=1 Tax=Rhodovastum atsumiense TaxID=504468 RepID=UPI00139F2C76|nr:hypothetical protein [Rhodovastum atsumiense]CAH2603207.1 exported protein of unknown function [Rhodovastum atsumiense]